MKGQLVDFKKLKPGDVIWMTTKHKYRNGVTRRHIPIKVVGVGGEDGALVKIDSGPPRFLSRKRISKCSLAPAAEVSDSSCRIVGPKDLGRR